LNGFNPVFSCTGLFGHTLDRLIHRNTGLQTGLSVFNVGQHNVGCQAAWRRVVHVISVKNGNFM